jgi:ribosomal protein S27AE
VTAKEAGADCPKCGEMFCAEHAQLNQPPRWTCGTCGASGTLTGRFDARRPLAPPPEPAPTVKRHWRDQRGSAALYVLIALAVSLLANLVLWNSLDEAQHEVTKLTTTLKTANEATEACNASIAGLEKAAEQRGRDAEKDRRDAEDRARRRKERADKELATPPTVPGDDCRSAQDRVRRAIAGRKTP